MIDDDSAPLASASIVAVDELIEVSRQSMEGVRGMSFTFGVPEVGGSIYSRMGIILDTESAETYLESYVGNSRRERRANSPMRLC